MGRNHLIKPSLASPTPGIGTISDCAVDDFLNEEAAFMGFIEEAGKVDVAGLSPERLEDFGRLSLLATKLYYYPDVANGTPIDCAIKNVTRSMRELTSRVTAILKL